MPHSFQINAISPEGLSSPLDAYDFVDSFLATPIADAPLRKLAASMFAQEPLWVKALMGLRNIAVSPFGLKSTHADFPPEQDFIGPFPVISENEMRLVLGLDDKHLDFRITVDRSDGDAIIVSTWVKTHNGFGRFYLACVMPFHKIIVPQFLMGLKPQVVV